MEAQPTKKMASLINRTMEPEKVTAYYTEVDGRRYELLTGIDNYYMEYDYNWNTGLYKLIVIEYPYNYYACNKYLNTDFFQAIAKKAAGNYNRFIDLLKDEIAI